MNQNKIGEFIAQKRKEKELTQTELGSLLGVSYKAVSKWENGKNMPDVSLFKELCNILNISLNELLTGEDNPKEIETENILLKTIKKKKNMDTITKLLIGLIIVMIIIIAIIMIYVAVKPIDDIYSISKVAGPNPLKKEIIKLPDRTIYFYGIDEMHIKTIYNDTYDLKDTLNDKEVTVDDLQKYLEKESTIERIDKYPLDDGTIIYQNDNYTMIYCYNKDVYIGNNSMQSDLKGKYCGYEVEPCYFTRTYSIIHLAQDEEFEYYQALVKTFQGPYSILRIPKDNYEMGVPYEFTFYTYNNYETPYFTPKNSILVEVNKTDKLGLDQKQEKACFTK